MRKTILFDAEPFCFGPISTTLNLVEYLKRQTKIGQSHDLMLLGTGTSRQLAEATGAFDSILECDTTSFEDLEKHASLIENADLFVSTTNPHSINFLNRFSTKRIFIDTLFWLWGELRADFSGVTTYYIQRFFNIQNQLERFGRYLPKAKVVNPLICFDLKKVAEESFILINLGGIDTVYHKTTGFYEMLIGAIAGCEELYDFPIIVAGGGETIKRLHLRYERKNLKIQCFGKKEFGDLFCRCSKFVTTPGLTSIHESHFLGKDVFFLPPQNYSQYLHLTYLQQKIPDVYGCHYADLLDRPSIPEGLPEEEGVRLVKELSNALISNPSAMNNLLRAFVQFKKNTHRTFSLCEDLAFTHSGVIEIGNDILSLCKADELSYV